MAAARAQPSDTVRYVGPGIDEALAGLLRYWAQLRNRLKGKGKSEGPPAEEPASAPEESDRS